MRHLRFIKYDDPWQEKFYGLPLVWCWRPIHWRTVVNAMHQTEEHFDVCSYGISSPSDRSKHIALSGHANYPPPPKSQNFGSWWVKCPLRFRTIAAFPINPERLYAGALGRKCIHYISGPYRALAYTIMSIL